MRLLRVLGIVFGVAVTLGGTLGIGILRTPGMVAASTGSAWATMLVWVFGAVFSLFAAASIADLAVGIPRTGGFYAYAREVFGGGLAFAVGWSDFLGQVAAIAYAAVTAADLLARLNVDLPAIVPALILGIGFLQWLGIRAASRTQQVMSFTLAACYFALIAVAFLFPSPVPESVAPTGAAPLAGAILALRAVIIAYDGWYSAIYFAEEVRDLPRNLPKAMIEGAAIVAVVYLGVNAALLHVLGTARLAASAFPGVDAARALFGTAGERMVIVVALLSIPSLVNALTLIATRILYGMGMDRVNRRGTPDTALAVAVVTALILALSGTFERLLAAAAFFFMFTYAGGFVCLLILRKKRSDAPRPFRAWLFPWSTGVLIALCLMFLVGDVVANPRDALQSALLIAASYPVYRLSRHFGGRFGNEPA